MSDQIDHIAELEKRLYARDPDALPQRKFGILRPLRNTTESVWGAQELPKETLKKQTKVSPYKKLFIGSLIFFLIGVGVALFSIYRGAVTLSSRNVEIVVLGNSFVGGGEALPVQVDITNKNSGDLLQATLTLSYPRGASALPGDVERMRRDVGVIGSGKTKTEAFSVVLYGEQGTTRELTATFEYKLLGSNTTFVREKTFSVVINASPVALVVDAPTAVGVGQPFTLVLRTKFTGDATLQNAIARVEYPNGFVFVDATPAPVTNNNTWDLRDMVEGTERTISIRGRLQGEELDEKAFRVYIGERTSETDPRIRVSYNSALHSVVISKPFIQASMVIAGQEGDIVALSSGDAVDGYIQWENTSVSDITDASFSLSLPENVRTESIDAQNSYFDQLSRTLVWDAQSYGALSRLTPGQSGQLPFRFLLRTPALGTEATLALSVKGIVPERGNEVVTIETIDQKEIRFAARLQFSSQALFSTGPIKNTGPFPPKAQQETSYSVVWTIRPVENPLTGVTAEAVLPESVTWTGVVAPQSETVTYNPQTRVVKWVAGTLPKATSTPQVRTVAFQIKVKPTQNLVGSELRFLGETTVNAFDSAAGVPLSITRPELTSKMGTDPLYSPGKEKVLP